MAHERTAAPNATAHAGTDAQPRLSVQRLGAMPYLGAWEMQRRLTAQRLAGEIPDTLLLLQHPPTITLGRRAETGEILATRAMLDEAGIALVETDRGGAVTYHGPGQLVGYPILDLRRPPHRPDVHAYVRALEETLIRALATFGVTAFRFPGYTGVWTDEAGKRAKIAAIGVRISRWITQHGFALNVDADLTPFGYIVPCGITDYPVTSIARLVSGQVTVADVEGPVERAFCEVFGIGAR